MRSRTAGVMTALMRNGRDRRSGKPVMGHAMLERVRMFGTRSADYIRASGHSGCIATEVILQATTGRIHDRTRTLRRKSDLLLHRGRRPYMTQNGHWLPSPLQRRSYILRPIKARSARDQGQGAEVMSNFNVGFVIFPDLTQLDFTGPLQILARLP